MHQGCRRDSPSPSTVRGREAKTTLTTSFLFWLASTDSLQCIHCSVKVDSQCNSISCAQTPRGIVKWTRRSGIVQTRKNNERSLGEKKQYFLFWSFPDSWLKRFITQVDQIASSWLFLHVLRNCSDGWTRVSTEHDSTDASLLYFLPWLLLLLLL